ncbi:MAG: aldehyde dehydrogenase family protein [Fimbriimonas sp.]
MVTEVAPLSHLIGGRFVAADGDVTPSVNPTRPRETLAMVPAGTPEAVRHAVDAADGAQRAWAALPGPSRAEHLYRWSDAIQARATELADAVAREVGKPIGEARGEVGRCTMILRYYAGEAVRNVGEVIPSQAPGSLQYTVREPLGVIGLITPWNFPLAIPLWKAAPALALGNTVVLKPAEASSFVASLLAQTALDAGLPAGVFNILFGHGSVIGEPLLRDPRVNGVSFTGSDKVGARVAETCAARNVRYQTEMGGKNVAIVLRDADIDQAANLVASGAMRYAGQKCTATSRVIVERSVRDAFQRALLAAVEALPVGDPSEVATAVGPVISRDSADFLNDFLEKAGGERIYQGTAQTGDLRDGFFVPPTVIEIPDTKADLAQQELFGPVLAWLEADDLDHALDLANDTRFGLSASLFTKDIPSALRYASRIQAGMVRVNADTTGVDPHAPFGGFKGSSSHIREQGPAARDFYTETKTIQINP